VEDSPRASCSAQLLRLEKNSANALSEIQTLISQLKPLSFAEDGLPATFCRLADERQARDGLQISLEIQGETSLSEAETLGLYSIVNEALTNIAKHSGTHEAIVRLRLNYDSSLLEIEDHGQGFDPRRVLNQRGYLGLIGISEREYEIGWMPSVESEKDRGKRILVKQNQTGG
jgi:signal transduction histidine kinase